MNLYFLRRIILFLWHAIVLITSYISFVVEQIKIFFTDSKLITDKYRKISQNVKSPISVALVIDEYSPSSNQKIIDSVNFLLNQSMIKNIVLFFTESPKSLNISSDKVTIFTASQNEEIFYDVMKRKVPLAETSQPFKDPLDLVIFFTRYPKLCNFFTWTLDLATLYFAGPISNMSPLVMMEAFKEFGHAEQRFGK
ncbi:hypothetical protein TRFO_20735 [Tritrichomonas foetus]|uniref:Uncharacterized protein n=1 Tax=Tritrichomonas foetus TaxID=1144522 RepID=A0A1J4KL53_9EUKA|nr:hypothetical protein TRFO_20735 [Tritrichomonas foetus]|eukprot:OHT10101.1 hypothetical protein TRFO_20735 [Tritrichomonas foetus]